MRWISGLLALALLAPGCRKMPDGLKDLDQETRAERKYVNLFAFNVMDTYYLWRDEIASGLEAWENWEEPIGKVAALRYKDAGGEDIDRWTFLTDDFASAQGTMTGHTRTLGMDFQLFYADEVHTRICAVVTFAYAGSPAAEAGVGRGDVVLTVDGQAMTPDNYRTLVLDHLLGGGTVKLGLADGRTVVLTAVDMYEDPVHTIRVLDRPDGRKVGYLHYTSFTLDSCRKLVEAFRTFRSAEIDDLVLDLRYNSGGYVQTEEVLASLLVPVKEIEAGSVFSREVFNSRLAAELGDECSRFQTNFLIMGTIMTILTTDGANPDLPRLYVLTSGSSASASECLVCGLKPYMEVTLIGERTAGKYCGGLLLEATDWFRDKKSALGDEYEKGRPYVENWGMYVMFSRYADCNGVTLSMPDGLMPDLPVEDNPLDGFQLGDPQETMLAAALEYMEGRTRSSAGRLAPALEPVPDLFHPRFTGLRLGTPRALSY